MPGWFLIRMIADLEQEQDADKRGQEGRATVGDKWECFTGERQQPQVTADDQNGLHGQICAQAGSEIPLVRIDRPKGDPQPPDDQQANQQELTGY